jgi:hypothetical protein
MEKLTVTATRMADCWPGSGYPLEWICKAYLEWAAGTLGEKFFVVASAGLWIRIDLMRIRIQHFSLLRIRIQFRIQDFDDKRLKNKLQLKKIGYFCRKKLKISYPYASIKDAQVTGEAFSPQKRTSSST